MPPFDPYHVWLGIPPGEQPPNHYRQLAIAPFEESPDVIENAADRQMAHVRRAATGKHGEASQQILGEIAAARRCLLDPQKKQQYDADLRQQQPSTVPPGVAATMEWQPSKPPKPLASPPPPRPKAEEPPQRWKGARHSEQPSPEPLASAGQIQANGTAAAVAVKTATSPALARARQKRGGPLLLLAVVAALAVLPIILLLAVIWSMSEPAVAAGDNSDASEIDSSVSPASHDGGRDIDPLPKLPEAGDDDSRRLNSGGTNAADDDQRFRRPPPPLPFRAPPGADENRDPFDDTASFGRTSGDPIEELSFDLSAKTTMIELAKLHLPPHAATTLTVKPGQIVRLKMSGQCRIGFQPYDIRGPEGVWVAIGAPNAPASQFFRGSEDIEFAVTKGGKLFLALDDLIPADNSGSLAVEVAVYE